MPELTLESLAARVAELERQVAEIGSEREARQRRLADMTAGPSLADNPMWDEFVEAMRRNREEMAREDAERWAAEDAAAATARQVG
jgi:molybdopterin-biosynthesis enzyme MoeA-like protein